jgi:hypothetical protein
MVQQSNYSEQMGELIDIQLDLEALGKEVVASTNSFTDARKLESDIRAIEEYLNELIDEYEKKFQQFMSGHGSLSLTEPPQLHDFLGPYQTSRFRTAFVERYDSALRAVQQDILAIRS